jgi:regulator of replication initiation timing
LINQVRLLLFLQLSQLNDDLQRKETKWAAAVTKLQEQVKMLEKENQHLHQENHKLKLKGVSSKVCHRTSFNETLLSLFPYYY